MSYKVKLTDEVVRKLSGWRLSSLEVREVRKGLDALSSHPKLLLLRVGPPYDALQYDLIITGGGPPRRDALYSFTVRYGADEQTLFVVDCELIVEQRPPLS
jgi:hypothetical protein